MSTLESWSLTPREFEARHRIRETYMAQQIAENRNAAHQLAKRDKTLWTANDFLETKQANEYRAAQLLKQSELAREKMREKQQVAAMKAGTFDESTLPVWARMTETEKKGRSN